MKKDKRKTGSFLSLLIRNYIGFSCIIFLIFAATSSFINWELNKRLDIPNPDFLDKYVNILEKGDYKEFPVKKVLGSKGGIAVLDENRKMVYRGDKYMPESFTEDELYCIPNAGSFEFTEMTAYTSPEGEKQILLKKYETIREEFDLETYSDSDSFMILDADYRVLNNMMDFPKEQMTKMELQYMTGTVAGPYSYKKYEFTDRDGKLNTVVLRYSKPDKRTYMRVIKSINKIWILTVPIYFIVVGLFAWGLSRKIKRPLISLSKTIVQFRQGQKPESIYKGPNEFVEIGDDFIRLAERLNESEEKRVKADKDKQKMLADISHDLKTPITVIQGYARAICDGVIPQERHNQYLKTIYNKATVLTELINTFYEYSKLEHPDFKPVTRRLDICEFAREYLASKYNEINFSGFVLDVNIPEEPLYCDIDAQQFKRVFENIIANSLKHNPKGTIITFLLTQEGDTIKIVIADNGLGIPKDIAKTIFEPFVVGDDSRNSRQGTGLGLAIARKIVVSHGGQIALAGVPENGFSTQFIIWMRVQKAEH